MILRVCILATVVIGTVFTNISNADEKTIVDALKKASPDMIPDSVTQSEVEGLYEVIVGPNLYYISTDGRYLLQGKLIDLKKKRDLTEPKIAKARVGAIGNVGSENMITFAPDSPKHTVSIFTDIDCGYCRKLHSEIDQYLKEGIKVQYLFFPRAGEGSDSYKKAVSVWCSGDRNDALTRAKLGKAVDSKQCDNPVRQHMALAIELGARGTPMIVTESGEILPGYVPAKQLSKQLRFKSASAR